MTSMILSELWRYPVKSMRGNRLTEISLDRRGLQHDRQWMLVDTEGHFLTQRQLPRMALLQAYLEDGQLCIERPDGELLRPQSSGTQLPCVQVWRDRCRADAMDARTDRWLSEFLGRACHLVEMPRDEIRSVDPNYADSADQVGFADGFPLLLISQASLDHLNQRLATPIEMVRFRPNLVISGCEAHAEDQWRRIRIGELTFRVAKPCARCVIPSIDPLSAERSPEIISTLKQYRSHDHQIWFGQNVLHDQTGILQQGMPVEVLE